MVELADTPDLGSGAKACRFKSCYPYQHLNLTNGSVMRFVKFNFLRFVCFGYYLGTIDKNFKKIATCRFRQVAFFFTFRLQVFQPRLQFLQAVRLASIEAEN